MHNQKNHNILVDMDISILLNRIKTQITPLTEDYSKKKELHQNVEDLNAKIKTIVKDGCLQITNCLAAEPISIKDLEVLKKFRDELQELDKIITNIGIDGLNIIIDKIQVSGADKAYFQSIPTLKDKIRFLLEKFKNFFIEKIQNKINQQIFFTWSQKLRFNSSLKKIVQLNEEIPKLEALIAKKPEDESLKKELKNKKSILTKNEKFVAEYAKNLEAGKKTRKQFESIGGTRLSLQTKDGEILDGTYLSAQNFQHKCLEAGAEQVKISIPFEDFSIKISGLLFSKEANASDFIKTLEQLKLFKAFHQDLSSSNKGGGWTKVNIGDQVAIIPDFEVEQLIKKGIVTEKVSKKELSENENSKVSEVSYSITESYLRDLKLDINPLEINSEKSGTVVMGMGAAGIYEMAKREAVALLMQGVNVMLFNHRGQGESSGKPSEKGSYEDMETVYQYLKQVKNIDDEKLVFRGLCLSGGIVSELASRHPNVNLILDQTYADINDIALNTVLESIKDIIGYDPESSGLLKKTIMAGLTPILRAVTNLFSPDFKTAEHLKYVQGKVLILRSTEDTYTSKEMTDKILEIYSKNSSAEKSKQIRVGHMPGIHGSAWLDARKLCDDEQKVDLGRYHILSFLQETSVLNPFIDEGSSLKEVSKDYNSYLLAHSQAMNAFTKTIQTLPENLNDVPKEMLQVPIQAIEETKITQTAQATSLSNVIDGRYKFELVLNELNRLKDKLGGSPHFGDTAPKLDEADSNKTFFGIPIAAVKDWLLMVLKHEWIPQYFWKLIANLFSLSMDFSQYEEAHTRIQRFGMLIANKERFNEILEKQDQLRYKEFLNITGMMWHPKDNGWGTEKTYIEFVEKFLTEDFEAAKTLGDEALIEYFNSFVGVCFEDRCRYLEAHAILHPSDPEISQVIKALEEIIDINFSLPVDAAFNEIGAKITSTGDEITPVAMLEYVKKDILGREFTKDNGVKSKATLKDFQDYAIDMITNVFIMDPYPILDDLLKVEFDILKESGQEMNSYNFKKQLERLEGKEIISAGNFSLNDPAIDTFIKNNFSN